MGQHVRQLSLEVWQQAYVKFMPAKEEAWKQGFDIWYDLDLSEPRWGDLDNIQDYYKRISEHDKAVSRYDQARHACFREPYVKAETKIEKVVIRGTLLSWGKTRESVWQRDHGICQVCKKIEPEFYECGHVVDRVCGGSDQLDNLVVMCSVCNRFKPCHWTRKEYELWVKTGYWKTDFVQYLKDEGTYDGILELLVRARTEELTGA